MKRRSGKFKLHTILFAATIIVNLAAEAQTVYQTRDDQGKAVFSDKPSPDGKAVDVNPNVINVEPATSVNPPQPTSPRAADSPTQNDQPGATPALENSGYTDTVDSRRERLRRAHERREHADAPVQLPAHNKPANTAVHGGAHRSK